MEGSGCICSKGKTYYAQNKKMQSEVSQQNIDNIDKDKESCRVCLISIGWELKIFFAVPPK